MKEKQEQNTENALEEQEKQGMSHIHWQITKEIKGSKKLNESTINNVRKKLGRLEIGDGKGLITTRVRKKYINGIYLSFCNDSWKLQRKWKS